MSVFISEKDTATRYVQAIAKEMALNLNTILHCTRSLTTNH